jgi:thioredoxin reductase (NADPH)
MTETWDLIVVGGGPGGLTAGLYAARMGLRVIILEAGICGGRMMNAWRVENYPGFDAITGGELAAKMREQAAKAGAVIREMTSIEKLKLSSGVKVATSSEGEQFRALAVILAMGACDAELGVAGESDYKGRGLSYCASCDGPLYRGKTVAVVGGGNTAAMDALFLANLAKKVYLIHRRDQLRAEKTYADRLLKTPNVEVLWETIVTAVLGAETVTGLKLHNKKTSRDWEQPVQGVFIAVGCHSSSSIVAPAGVKVDNEGDILVDANRQTNIPGVYAVGDVTGEPRQIVRACGDAVVAVIHWLSTKPTTRF